MQIGNYFVSLVSLRPWKGEICLGVFTGEAVDEEEKIFDSLVFGFLLFQISFCKWQKN